LVLGSLVAAINSATSLPSGGRNWLNGTVQLAAGCHRNFFIDATGHCVRRR